MVDSRIYPLHKWCGEHLKIHQTSRIIRLAVCISPPWPHNVVFSVLSTEPVFQPRGRHGADHEGDPYRRLSEPPSARHTGFLQGRALFLQRNHRRRCAAAAAAALERSVMHRYTVYTDYSPHRYLLTIYRLIDIYTDCGIVDTCLEAEYLRYLVSIFIWMWWSSRTTSADVEQPGQQCHYFL